MFIKIDRISSRLPGEKQQLVHGLTQPVEQKDGFMRNSIEQGPIRRSVSLMQSTTCFAGNRGTPAIMNTNFRHGFCDAILDRMNSGEQTQQSVAQLLAKRALQSRH